MRNHILIGIAITILIGTSFYLGRRSGTEVVVEIQHSKADSLEAANKQILLEYDELLQDHMNLARRNDTLSNYISRINSGNITTEEQNRAIQFARENQNTSIK